MNYGLDIIDGKFINNKYYLKYQKITKAAKLRLSIKHGEKHHILPKSMGGSDEETNLVMLTYREHYICHWLLPKCTVGKDCASMYYAFKSMRIQDKSYVRSVNSSREYEVKRVARLKNLRVSA